MNLIQRTVIAFDVTTKLQEFVHDTDRDIENNQVTDARR